jgi:predicted HicB family RNase H-like nuclease
VSNINVRNVPEDLHRLAKAQAALEGITMQELVIRAIREYLDRETKKKKERR